MKSIITSHANCKIGKRIGSNINAQDFGDKALNQILMGNKVKPWIMEYLYGKDSYSFEYTYTVYRNQICVFCKNILITVYGVPNKNKKY